MCKVEIYGVTNPDKCQRNGVALPRQGFHIETSPDVFAEVRRINTAGFVARNLDVPRNSAQDRFYDRLKRHINT